VGLISSELTGIIIYNNENYRINSPTISFQNSNGRIGVPINAYFNVFAQGGYSNNNYQSSAVNNTGNNSSGAITRLEGNGDQASVLI